MIEKLAITHLCPVRKLYRGDLLTRSEHGGLFLKPLPSLGSFLNGTDILPFLPEPHKSMVLRSDMAFCASSAMLQELGAVNGRGVLGYRL